MQERQAEALPIEIDPADLAREIVEVASDKKASDVLMLDIRRQTTFADYFVIMSGTSKVQVRTLAENIRERMLETGARGANLEGTADEGWILIDYGSVVVHIFRPEQRTYYGLEDLWSGAVTVVRLQ